MSVFFFCLRLSVPVITILCCDLTWESWVFFFLFLKQGNESMEVVFPFPSTSVCGFSLLIFI